MRLTGSCREGQLCGLGRMWAKGIAMGHRVVCPSLIHDHELGDELVVPASQKEALGLDGWLHQFSSCQLKRQVLPPIFN
jgi:hypothetical protein